MAKYHYSDGSVLCRHDPNRILHRADGPAIEYRNGSREWVQNDRLHRLNGPAIEYNSVKMWYQNGELHRLDGPAVEHSDGEKQWYIKGKLQSTKKEFEKTILVMKLSGLLDE